MNKNSFDIFDVSSEDIKDTSLSTMDQDLYKPSPENGRNGSYSSIIRFISWWDDPKQSLVKKWTVFLEDPVSGKKRTVDCPSTKNEKSVLRDMFFKLYKSNSVREKELAEKFKRKRACYSLIQIIRDENRPELEGKILVFRFGQKILDKISNEMQPPLGGKPRKPFHPIHGRPFSLIVTKKGGYSNYDDSYFLDEPYALRINGQEIDNDTDPETLKNWLKENSPNLENYFYKKWDDQVSDFVNDVIRNTVPNGRIIEETLSAKVVKKADSSDEAPKSSTKAVKATATSINIEDDIVSSSNDDINFDDDDDDFYKGLEDDE